MATNFDMIDPPSVDKRCSRKENKSVSVKQPKLIRNYNKYMGGVNLLDNFVAMYKVKDKKWWWPIFTNFIDVANTMPKISLSDFQRSLALALLKTREEYFTICGL
ncbi:hypothetical protein X975_07503, partial [Stegodyphus mimosarum]